MISAHTPLKKIRFDVDVPCAGKQLKMRESRYIGCGLSFDDNLRQYFLLFKIRINYFNEINDEIVGYLGERIAVLQPTNIKRDKISLVSYLSGLMNEADEYIKTNTPVSLKLTQNVPLDVGAKSDEILDFLKSNGLY